LTQVMAEERGMTVDVERFHELMEQRRQQSRAGMAGGDARQSLVDLVQQGDLPETAFIGYHRNTEVAGETTPLHLFREGEQTYQRVDQASQGQSVAVVVNRTPFYAEAGGQVGDQGVIQVAGGDSRDSGGRVNVTDTIKVGNTTFHLGTVASDAIEASDSAPVSLAVDKVRREKTMANHTSTHLLNKALRDLVNPEADQKGSLVDPDRLRFDFSHTAALTSEQIERVEAQVNGDIDADLPVYADVAPQEKGRAIHGLRAVFGEQYPDHVRIVSIGQPVEKLLEQPDNPEWANYSIEFCGGTHLDRTSEAERFTIVQEEGVAKGIRRVVALTGEAADQAEADGDALLDQLRAAEADSEQAEQDRLNREVSALNDGLNKKTLSLKARHQLRAGVSRLQETIKKLEKQRADQAQAQVVETARDIAENAEGPVIVEAIEGADGKTLRKAMDVIRKKRPECAMLLAGTSGEKVAIVAAVPEAMQQQGLKAGDWVGEVAPVVGGGGGGKPDTAQAGGKDPSKVNEALEKARDVAAAKVG